MDLAFKLSGCLDPHGFIDLFFITVKILFHEKEEQKQKELKQYLNKILLYSKFFFMRLYPMSLVNIFHSALNLNQLNNF